MQLSFEYLVSADKLQWITVISQSVFFISVCLQATVDELMMKKNGSLTNNVSEKIYFLRVFYKILVLSPFFLSFFFLVIENVFYF